MSFTPNNPETVFDLEALCDPEQNVVAVYTYTCDEGYFFRVEKMWKRIPEDGEWEFDLDDLIVIYVLPEFTPIFDSEEDTGDIINIQTARMYSSIDPEDIEYL